MKLSKNLLFIVLCGISGAAQTADAGELAAQAADAAAARAAQVQAAQAAADAAARSAQAGDTVAAGEREEALREAQVKPMGGGRSMFSGLRERLGLQTGITTTSGSTGRTTTSPISTEPVIDGPIKPTAVQTEDALAALEGGTAGRIVTRQENAQSRQLQVVKDRIDLLGNLSKNTDLTSMDILSRTIVEIREMGNLYNQKAFSIKTLSAYADSINQFFMKFDSTKLTEQQLEQVKSMITDVLTSREVPVKSISLELFNSLKSTSEELDTVSLGFAKQRFSLKQVRKGIGKLQEDDQTKFNGYADGLLSKPLTLTQLRTHLSSLTKAVISCRQVQESVAGADVLFSDQSSEIKGAVHKVFAEQQLDFQKSLDAAFKDDLSEDSVMVLMSKSQGIEGLLKSYTTASEKVSEFDDRVNRLAFTAEQKNFYEKLKNLIISSVRQTDNTQVLVNFVNAVETQNKITALEGALDKPVTSSLIDPLMERFTEVDGTFIKRLNDQLTTLKTDQAQLVREQNASLIRLSPVTALVQRDNNTFQEASTRANKALTGLSKLCRVFSKRLADWVEAKKEYIVIQGRPRDLTFADFKQQLGDDAQKVQVLSKAVDTNKLQQLGTDLPLLKFGKTQLTKFLVDLQAAQSLLKSKQIISVKNGQNVKTIDDLLQEVTDALVKVDAAIKVADGTTEKQEKAFGLALSDIAKSLAYIKAQSKTISYTFPLSDFDENAVNGELQKIEVKLEQLKANSLLTGSDDPMQGQFDTQRSLLEKQLVFFKDQLAYYKSFRAIIEPVNRAYTFITDVNVKDAFGNYENAVDLAQYQNSLDTLQNFIKTKQAPQFAGPLQLIKKQLELFVTTAQATLKTLQSVQGNVGVNKNESRSAV